MNPYSHESVIFWFLLYLWVALEMIFSIRARILKRKQPKRQHSDRGSFFLIVFGMYMFVFIEIFLSIGKIGLLPEWTKYIGYLLMAFGMIVRYSAIVQLGRFFSPVVGIVSDQEIINTGWYRLIRHPSYTGGWLTPVGVGLVAHTWIGTLICAIGLLLVYGYRIRVEERALIDHFGDKYIQYRKQTKKIFPWIL